MKKLTSYLLSLFLIVFFLNSCGGGDDDLGPQTQEVIVNTVENEPTTDREGLTFVPDDLFEQALISLGYDDEVDDYVLTENIASVTTLDVSDKGISDLTGIEDFASLTNLRCFKNNLNSLI